MTSWTNRTIAELTRVIRLHHAWVAAGLLALMGLLSLGSMVGNSAIVDEIAHIPAGYSYLHYGDYRLNPEHPPLIKDLAGLPLQYLDLKFPLNQPAWASDVNGQWEAGWHFLYHIGNDADQILFWARLPILLLALGFGVALYLIVRRRWGTEVGLLTLFFYALSPNFMAHDTLVTTDLGAAVFMFLGVAAFAWFIEKPTKKTMIVLSLALAAAQLAKFSGFFTLLPFLGTAATVLALILRKPAGTFWMRLKVFGGGFTVASVLSYVWVWIFYIPQVANMPVAVQDALIRGSIDHRFEMLINALLTLNHLPLMESLVQYLLGLVMVFGRVTGGNTTYFNGEVTNQSFHWYFPELLVLKTQVAFLLLALALIGLAWWHCRKVRPKELWGRWTQSVREHMWEWNLGLFAAFYFGISVAGNLNLGIRHILPVYLPIFVVVAVGVVIWSRRLSANKRFGRWVRPVMAVLLLWYGASAVVAYPNYLSYFNEIIGGGQHADKYFSDSSVDWGQDLKRFVKYAKAHPEIKHIALDYFGGGLPEYYFCQRRLDENGMLIANSSGYDCSTSRVENWHARNGIYTGQYIAVSETFLENDRFYASRDGYVGYDYLREREPIAKIGNSIYVYKLY